MVENEYSTIIYRSLNISTGIVIKNPHMLKFVPHHLKTGKMCKLTVKKLQVCS